MPASQRSLRVTDAYRDRLAAIQSRIERESEATWPSIENFDRDSEAWLDSLTRRLEVGQREAIRATEGYLSAYLTTELGKPTRGPALDTKRWAGRARDDRPLSEALRSILTGTLWSLARVEPEAALKFGIERAKLRIDMDLKHAARDSLRAGMEEDERIVGWNRAVRGTCGACMGDTSNTSKPPGDPMNIHPYCACVAEPKIKGGGGGAPIRALDKAGTPALPGEAKFNGTLHGSARTSLEGKADDAIRLLSEKHKWPESDRVIPMRPVESADNGGYSMSGGVPQEIRVNASLSAEQTTSTVVHEAGHYLDNLLGNISAEFISPWSPRGGFLSEQGKSLALTDTGKAMKQFVSVARNSPTMKTLREAFRGETVDYLISPRELWARAYSQWLTKHPSPELVRTEQAGGMGLSWTEDEFVPIGKAVEKVLKKAGLLE